jgi:DNA-binding response OmpR family regulator
MLEQAVAKAWLSPAGSLQGMQREASMLEHNHLSNFEQAVLPHLDAAYNLASVDLKEIHRLSRFLPVIVLIPRSAAADQVASQTMLVTKSSSEGSDTTKLLGALRKAVERFQCTSAETAFPFDDVTVNFPSMEVLRKGKPVVLTTREFKTLKYFIQNARRVISRDELLNEVWGYENYPCTRTVDNHVLRLRQKLERDPSRPVHFRTVHGAGYKFLP